MKTYRGYTDRGDTTGEVVVLVYEESQQPYPLPHIPYHSTDGYNWGYGGSGPADLARSLLADYLGEQPHRFNEKHRRTRTGTLYQQFKWEFIARLEQDRGWILTGAQIEDWLSQQEQKAVP